MARELKRNKTKLEKLIRTVWQETKKGTVIISEEQQSVITATNKTLDYFEMYDYLHNENFNKIFKRVYLSMSRCLTQRQVSNLLHYSKNSVGKYCALFIKAFEKYLNEI